MGIEPTYPAWKAGVLPLNYTRSYEIINLHPSMRAIDGARTRGLDLGKVARYQLRHYRICRTNSTDLIIIHDFTYFVNVIFVFFHVQNMLLSADNQSG